MIARFPIMLPNRHIAQLLDRNATTLIMGRALRLGPATPVTDANDRVVGTTGPQPQLYEVHNTLVIRRNLRHCRNHAPDLQENPHVLTIEIDAVSPVKLADVGDLAARSAGYHHVDQMLDDWRRRHQRIDLERTVHVHHFRIVEARYLHEKVHLGYTHDPSRGAAGEPEALSEQDVEQMATANRQRFELERADHIQRRRAKSLAVRLKHAIATDDDTALAEVQAEIEQLRQRLQLAS